MQLNSSNFQSYKLAHAKQRVVLTNGCFDILHIGHARYLQAAKKTGDLLIVGVNSDASVRQLKGPTRPVNKDIDRAELLLSLGCVDATFIFSETTADKMIQLIQPDVYVKAGDYSEETLPETPTLKALGIEIVFMPFVHGYSTTQILNRS